jgi:hypothetical protein
MAREHDLGSSAHVGANEPSHQWRYPPGSSRPQAFDLDRSPARGYAHAHPVLQGRAGAGDRATDGAIN